MTLDVTVPLIKVSIAKLGTSIQDVEVAVGSTAMIALRKAGYNLDNVVSIKRNGSVIALDAPLAHEDVLLVSMDKIKGGAEDEDAGNPIRLSFTIRKENAKVNGQLVFLDSMSTFEIIKTVMNSRGVSLNSFKEIHTEDGKAITFADKLEDGKSYEIIIADTVEQPSEDDEADED